MNPTLNLHYAMEVWAFTLQTLDRGAEHLAFWATEADRQRNLENWSDAFPLVASQLAASRIDNLGIFQGYLHWASPPPR